MRHHPAAIAILGALGAAAAASPALGQASAIDAERQFAADAQALGQWTAFRKWSTPEAIMFLPLPSNAHAFFKDRKDPETAVFWWPGRSYVSCDGTHAINTGPWVRQWGKSVGYFTTVWKRQPDSGWKWVYDAGDELAQARPEGGDIKPQIASCEGTPSGAIMLGSIGAVGHSNGGGRSPDGTLVWSWASGPKGDRRFLAQLWTGTKFETVIEDEVEAPPE